MPCPSILRSGLTSTLIAHDLVPTSVSLGSGAFRTPPISSDFPPSSYTVQHPSISRTDDHSATLSMIAASASSLEEMLPYGERLERHDMNGISVTDIDAESMHRNSQACDVNTISPHPPLQAYVNGMEREVPDEITPKASQFLRPLAMNLNGAHRYSSAEHTTPHGRAQRTRGKLSSLRRQEVQNMRKQGACIRCRMLRKTVRSHRDAHSAPLRQLTPTSAVETILAKPAQLSPAHGYGSSTAYEQAL